MQKVNIENNNHRIGKVKVSKGNFRKFMVIATLGFAVLTTSGCHTQKRTANTNSVKDISETTENTSTKTYEPRYNNIEYVVKWGDSLTKIVASYESDYNLILRYVDEIERDNKINGILKQGITIRLWGVPESKLADYGYTADYSIIGYDVMVKDAYNWLVKERERIVESEFNKANIEQFNTDFTEFVIQYNAYLTEEDENKKQQKLDALVELLNDVLGQFKSITGFDFAYHHQAYPMPQEMEYENVLIV